MKIAVFHNFLDNIGGAEIVALTLTRELSADLYTTNISAENISRMGFGDLLPRIQSIGKIPTNAPWRHQLALWKFRRLNLGKKYDFYIIAGDWAMSGAVNHKPNLWYVHSPLNELWEFKKYIRTNVLPIWKRHLYDIWVFINRIISKNYSKHVGHFVANSSNVKERLLKYYGVSAVDIIHPPIDTKKYTRGESDGYWLSVNRLITHKRVELQLEAFGVLPHEKLIIVGSYEKGARQFENYKGKLEKIRPANVTIINWADNQKLRDLYTKAKGFIATAMNEDFGMTVVEAMASGKPVIAPNEGGFKESLVDGETGKLIDDISSKKIVTAIHEINNELAHDPDHYKRKTQERAALYDTEKFTSKIRNIINTHQ